jgi:hypothetical protein
MISYPVAFVIFIQNSENLFQLALILLSFLFGAANMAKAKLFLYLTNDHTLMIPLA